MTTVAEIQAQNAQFRAARDSPVGSPNHITQAEYEQAMANQRAMMASIQQPLPTQVWENRVVTPPPASLPVQKWDRSTTVVQQRPTVTPPPTASFLPVEPGTPQYYTQKSPSGTTWVASHSGAPIAPRYNPEMVIQEVKTKAPDLLSKLPSNAVPVAFNQSTQELSYLTKEQYAGYQASVDYYTKAGYPEFAGKYAPLSVPATNIAKLQEVPSRVTSIENGKLVYTPTPTLVGVLKTAAEQAGVQNKLTQDILHGGKELTLTSPLGTAPVLDTSEKRELALEVVTAAIIAPSLGVIGTAKAIGVGIGVGQIVKTGSTVYSGGNIWESGLTGEEIIRSGATGVIFTGVGKGMLEGVSKLGETGAKIAGYVKMPTGEIVPVLPQTTKEAVGASLGRFAISAFGDIPVSAGMTYMRKGDYTEADLVSDVALSTLFAGIGEFGVPVAGRVVNKFVDTTVGGKLVNAVADFNERIRGVKATAFKTGKELVVYKAGDGEIDIASFREFDTYSTRITKKQADLFRNNPPSKAELAGTEVTRSLVGGSEVEPDFLTKTNYQLQVTKRGNLAEGQVRILETSPDYTKIMDYESKATVSKVLSDIGEQSASEIYMAQRMTPSQFEQTRPAQPVISTVKGENIAQTKMLIGDLRKLTDVSEFGLSKGISDIVFDVDAQATVKLMTGKGSVRVLSENEVSPPKVQESLVKATDITTGVEKTDTNLLFVTKNVKIIGGVPETQFTVERTISDIQLWGKAKEPVLPIPKDAGIEAPKLGVIKEAEYAQDFSGVTRPKSIKTLGENLLENTVRQESELAIKTALEDMGEQTGLPSKYDEGTNAINQKTFKQLIKEQTTNFIADLQTGNREANILTNIKTGKVGEVDAVSALKDFGYTENAAKEIFNLYSPDTVANSNISKAFLQQQSKIKSGLDLKEYNRLTAKNVGGEKPFEGYIKEGFDPIDPNAYEAYSRNSNTAKLVKELQSKLPKSGDRNTLVALPKNILDVAPKSLGVSLDNVKQTISNMSVATPTFSQQTLRSSVGAQQIINPFLSFRGKAYYNQNQREQYDDDQIFVSYPQSGLPQPQAIANDLSRNVKINVQFKTSQIFDVNTIGQPQPTKPTTGTIFDQNYKPKEIGDLTGGTMLTPIGGTTIIRLPKIIPQPIQDQEQSQKQIPDQILEQDTRRTDTITDIFDKPPYQKTSAWFIPSGGKSGFSSGGIFRSGRKTGKKSYKREYPILTGLQLLGAKESGEERSVF
jgi:hypothetical protein